MRRRIPLAAAALAALVLPAPGLRAALPKEGAAWLEMRTRHFVLYGNATETRMREIAQTLERFQAVLGSLTPGRAMNLPLATAVYVFADDEDFTPYKPLVNGKPARVGGWFRGGRDANTIAFPARWNSDPRPIVYHEYLHWILENNFPPQPVWFSEGIAEYYATFEADEKRALVGRAHGEHVQELRESAPWPLQQLFAVTGTSREYREPALKTHFYAESWALVHMLLHGEPNRTQPLFRYLRMRREGIPEPEAFRNAFGSTEEAMLSDLAAYVRASRFAYSQIPLKEGLESPVAVATRKIPRTDVLVHLAELLEAEGPDRAREVEEHLAAALERSPCHAQALALLARRRAAEKRWEEAQALLEEAEGSDRLDPRLPYSLGEILIRRAFGDRGVDRSRVEAARAAYRRSLALDPWPPVVHAALGRTYFVESGASVREGIAELEAAVERLPARPDLLGDLAVLYARTGDRRRSDELSRAAGEADRLAADDSRQDRLARTLGEVNRLLETQREEEGLALLAATAAQAQPDVRVELERDLARLRATAGRNAEIRRYNDAIGLLNAQKLPEARAAFHAIERDAKDPEIVREAAVQGRRIDEFLAARRPKR